MTTVSARIDDDLKRQIDEHGIDTSKVVREALENEVQKRRREAIKQKGEELKGALSEAGVTSEDIAETISEDRDADLKDR